jgi:hypothetical protein
MGFEKMTTSPATMFFEVLTDYELQKMIIRYSGIHGLDYGHVVEINGVRDERDAFCKMISIFSIITNQLNMIIGKRYKLSELVEQYEEACSWAKKYQSEEPKLTISSDAEQNGTTLGTNV